MLPLHLLKGFLDIINPRGRNDFPIDVSLYFTKSFAGLKYEMIVMYLYILYIIILCLIHVKIICEA